MNATNPTWPSLTESLVLGQDLPPEAAAWAMNEVMDGAATPVQLAGFLVALAAKGVTSRELAALADVMISHARPIHVPAHAVDVVGTGGDLAQTVNISTMASVIVAATGRQVVKHGNRSASSASGSADVLEVLGVDLDLPVESVEAMVRDVGITFLFAVMFHPSMRHAAEARRGLRIPTVLNILGPITNPGKPLASAVGVAKAPVAPVIADVFASRGTSALVFRGQDGLDEITVQAPSDVWEVRGGVVTRRELDPRSLLGIPRSGMDALKGGTAQENAEVAMRIFAGETEGRLTPIRQAVLLNAAAGVLAHDGIGVAVPEADFEERFRAAYEEVGRTVDEGAASELIGRWARASTAAGASAR